MSLRYTQDELLQLKGSRTALKPAMAMIEGVTVCVWYCCLAKLKLTCIEDRSQTRRRAQLKLLEPRVPVEVK